MSSSHWAWTEGCALAGGTKCGAGKQTPSLIRRALVLATGALVVGAMPAPALAHSGHAAHSKSNRRVIRDSHLAAHSPRSRADGRSIRVLLSGHLLLAPGAGYGTAGGSPAVRAMQMLLARAEDRPGPIDGLYGPLTEHAVRRFQAAHGLAVDGIAGPVTVAAITSPTPVLYPGAGYGLNAGSTTVRTLQRTLHRLGFFAGRVDGRYGPLTIHAVQRFQRAHGLEPDVVVGARTERALSASARHRVVVKQSTHRRLTHHRVVKQSTHRRLTHHRVVKQSTHRRLTHHRALSANGRHRVAVKHSAHRRLTHHRAQIGRLTRLTPRHQSVVRRAGSARHLPSLPVALLLLGMATMGLGVAALSYERTRAKGRRAREGEPRRGTTVTPPFPPGSLGSNGPLVGTAEERER
jgi:peptidoglycan hydrolase-like protein with peptidoglycan-binding domain